MEKEIIEEIVKILKKYQDPAEDLNHNVRGTALFSHLYEDVAGEIIELMQPNDIGGLCKFYNWVNDTYALCMLWDDPDKIVKEYLLTLNQHNDENNT